MKTLPKSMRQANRYLLVNIDSQPCSALEFESAFVHAATQVIGTMGLAAANYQLVKDRFIFPHAIIRCNATGLETLKAILPLIITIQQRPCAIRSVKASSQLNKLPGKPTGRGKTCKV